MNIEKKLSEIISYYEEYDNFTGNLTITGKVHSHRCRMQVSREMLMELNNTMYVDVISVVKSRIFNEMLLDKGLIIQISRDIKISEILNSNLESHEKDIIFV